MAEQDSTNSIGLSELIAQLRQELHDAMAEGEGQALRFEMESIELELQVAVERAGGAGARVKFWVLEAGADGKLDKRTTQTVKLRLKPAGDRLLGA